MLALEHEIVAKLRANGHRSVKTGRREDNLPVLRLVAETGERWVVSEIRADSRDLAFAVYDAGDGSRPSAGWVSLAELAFARTRKGRLLDIDRAFRPGRPLSQMFPFIRLAGSVPSKPTRH